MHPSLLLPGSAVVKVVFPSDTEAHINFRFDHALAQIYLIFIKLFTPFDKYKTANWEKSLYRVCVTLKHTHLLSIAVETYCFFFSWKAMNCTQTDLGYVSARICLLFVLWCNVSVQIECKWVHIVVLGRSWKAQTWRSTTILKFLIVVK